MTDHASTFFVNRSVKGMFTIGGDGQKVTRQSPSVCLPFDERINLSSTDVRIYIRYPHPVPECLRMIAEFNQNKQTYKQTSIVITIRMCKCTFMHTYCLCSRPSKGMQTMWTRGARSSLHIVTTDVSVQRRHK